MSLNRRATLVNLQRIDKINQIIIDFLSGTVYAIGGDIQRVGTDIFLCTPDNVEVAGSITIILKIWNIHSTKELTYGYKCASYNI